MKLGVTFGIVALIILLIWVFFEFKRFKHKIWAVLLILLILFTYFSFASVIKGKEIDIKSLNGMKEAGKLYVVWLGHAFVNLKTITTNAIDMDWKGNENITNST